MREKCEHEILEMQRKHGHQMHQASEEASVHVKGLEKDYQSQLKTSVSVGFSGGRQSPLTNWRNQLCLCTSSTGICALVYTHTHTHMPNAPFKVCCHFLPQSDVIQELEVRVAELAKSEEMMAEAYSRLAKEKVALEQTLEAMEGELHTVRERSVGHKLVGGCVCAYTLASSPGHPG